MPNLRLVVRTRVQLLWMDFSVARSYYTRYVLPTLVDEFVDSSSVFFTLERIDILRENYHNRIVSYAVRVSSSEPPPTRRSSRRYLLRQVDLLAADDRSRDGTSLTDRMSTLSAALRRTRNNKSAAPPAPVIPATTCFDFWQTESWWRDRVPAYWYDHPLRRNSRRVTHLLNQQMRVLRQLYRRDVASALRVLAMLQPAQIDLLDRMFVEPINGSLIASHLSTIFVHNEQQTGLNMKHEANKLLKLTTRNLQSDRDFDPKIHLKMCTSCLNRDIFELMVLVRLQHHHHRADDAEEEQKQRDQQQQDDERRRHDYIFCRCSSCTNLRHYANAWRYYDCSDNVWVRFEFPRKAYQLVSELLLRETTLQTMQLIYSSDKNEFHDQRRFVDNFVNYYVFYENGQHPLVVSQCTGSMRNTVSVLYVFAVINWVMIADSRERNINNSISLNQQSLCKSLGNTVYSIFSENCINQVRGEQTRRVFRENAAYINRGLGMVPNTGINAFHTTHTLYHP